MASDRSITFMTANFVARQLDYRMTGPWAQGDAATQEHFRPIETFGERFDEILSDVTGLGFRAIDLWSAHLNPAWATDRHVEIARELLQRHDLPVQSLGGGFGDTPALFEGFCGIARALDCDLLAGRTPLLESDRGRVIDVLGNHGVRLGIENHPEHGPEQMLEQIGDTGGGTLGTALDTGWWATQGYDAADAIEALREHLLHVHLKDVTAEGLPHETCRWGEGIVDVEACVRRLEAVGYQGHLCIEHEPEHHDPSEDCRQMLVELRAWL